MIKKLTPLFALAGFAVSLPASAVVSLHGAAPHAGVMLVKISHTGVVATTLGAVIVACAFFYRYRKANY